MAPLLQTRPPALSVSQRLKLAFNYKTAQNPVQSIIPPQATEGQFRAARQLLSLLGGGLAVGAGARGLLGVRDVLSDRQYAPSASAQIPTSIQLQAAASEEEEEPGKLKLAQSPAPLTPSLLDTPAGYIAPSLPKPNQPLGRELLDRNIMPLAALVTGGGLYGGYKLTDWLLDKERKHNSTSQVNEAEDDYRAALAEQYRAAMRNKRAGDALGVDELADIIYDDLAAGTKQAQDDILDKTVFYGHKNIADAFGGPGTWEQARGVVNVAALMTALGAGALTYNATSKNNKQKVLAEALRRRQQQRAKLSPPPIQVEVPDDYASV